jgi:DNA processing protein
LETLGQELSRSTADLAEQLFQLELQGVVCAEPGMRWRLA